MTEQEKREKVIKGLEICSAGEWNSTGGRDHTDCPYYPAGYTGCTCKLLMRDALAMLKAQEPVEPKKLMEKNKNGYRWRFYCGKCGDEIDRLDKYCRHCGRPVKWDG
jgi:hypothetical protein